MNEIHWFGEPWGAPINISSPRCEVPVLAICGRCSGPIAPNDQGIVDCSDVAYHLDCHLKMVIPHEQWAAHDLEPAPGDGFTERADGLLACSHCGWAFDAKTGHWYFLGIA